MVDKASYVPAAADIVTADGKLWGAPTSFGNQLMLYWNKATSVTTAPADSDAWVAKAKELTTGGNYGIVFNQTESFWLVPFLGGFGGSVFAEDGVTPTLDTDAMKSALQFMYDLKYTDKVMPTEADYNVADGLFKDGKAAVDHQRRLDARRLRRGPRRQARRRPAAEDHRLRLPEAVHRRHVPHGQQGRGRQRRTSRRSCPTS